jgi:uncharacterized protein YcbK (DUF882 family)
MKTTKVHIAIILTVLAAVVTVVSLSARSSHGQAPRPKTTSRIKPAVPERASSAKGGNSAAFAAAATQNVQLRNELSWTFGGKQQRGWYLYDLLISKTLDTQDDATSSDFAAAVASWQKRAKLTADGVLDQDAFMRMVSQWQSNRLKNRGIADPSQLVMGSPSDFYDPDRAAEMRQVERNTYAAYQEMIAAAHADPLLKLSRGDKYLKIISSFRTPEYQNQLRQKSPTSGTAGLAVNSPHFTGRALDLYVGGDPVDTKDANRAIQVNTPAYRWLVRNAERFGFRPYFYEPWHWEYVK